MISDENQSTQCYIVDLCTNLFPNYSFPWKTAVSKIILSDNALLHSCVICSVFPILAYRFIFFFCFQILAYLNQWLELSGQWFSLHLNHKYVIVLSKFKIKTMCLLLYQTFLPSRQSHFFLFLICNHKLS